MSVTADFVPIEVTLRGNVGSGAGQYARTKVANALGITHRPILHAHVVLEWRHDPALERPALAEATADVDGRLVRAKTTGSTMPEAVDELEYRLRRQLAQLQDRARTRSRWTGIASEHEWRHGDLPRRPMAYFPRPEETREVVRHKSFASAALTLDEAAYEMDLLGHDFFLFRDAASGRPAMVHRLPGGGYGAQGADLEGAVSTVTVGAPPPRLTDGEARLRLEANDEPFVFYLDLTSGEGRVLYHRYDGHYGLIELAG